MPLWANSPLLLAVRERFHMIGKVCKLGMELSQVFDGPNFSLKIRSIAVLDLVFVSDGVNLLAEIGFLQEFRGFLNARKDQRLRVR